MLKKKRGNGKVITMCKLNNTSLNNQWSKKKPKEKFKKYLETNENGNTTYQNLWEAAQF